MILAKPPAWKLSSVKGVSVPIGRPLGMEFMQGRGSVASLLATFKIFFFFFEFILGHCGRCKCEFLFFCSTWDSFGFLNLRVNIFYQS